MERIETKLKQKMKTSNNVPYPNFDQMWDSIQQDELKIINSQSDKLRPQKRKRYALIAGICLALMATPVYAALTYDWSSILSHREGIQTALQQGLGQTIDQSITKEGVTLTVHTAFIDDNRTFLLYSLKPGSSWNGKYVDFDRIGLKDNQGNFIEGSYVHHWNEEIGEFQGYFESDWVVKGQTADVEFAVENVRIVGEEKQDIHYNLNDPNKQLFSIQKDGIENVTLQSFKQSEDRILLQSAITYTEPEMKNRGWAGIQVVDGNDPIQEVEIPLLGTPGASGESLNQQVYESDVLRGEGIKFQLHYDRTLNVVENTWNLNLALSKKQLKNGSFKEVLNIPFGELTGTVIHEMTVTPTQIRLILNHEKKYSRVPYMDYQLEVNGELLDGAIWIHPNQTELRFEMVGLDPASLANHPVNLIAKHRVDEVDGDGSPIHLTDISDEHQSVTSEIAGYPITWTYYMKDNNLYVESKSSDSEFGGVNQTYYLVGRERTYGFPAITKIVGADSNNHIDVYENFDKTELEIYILKYTTHKRNDELRIPIMDSN